MKKGITVAEAYSLADTRVRARWRTHSYRKPKHRLWHHLPFVKEPERHEETLDHEAEGYFTVSKPAPISLTLVGLGIVWETGCQWVDTVEDLDDTFEFVEWEIVEEQDK